MSDLLDGDTVLRIVEQHLATHFGGGEKEFTITRAKGLARALAISVAIDVLGAAEDKLIADGLLAEKDPAE